MLSSRQPVKTLLDDYGKTQLHQATKSFKLAKRVTIKSIAQDLGISHMTASRALSNHPNVNKETREAIITRANELGYVKNAAAKAMRGDGSQIVGLLLPNIVNEFYARFANAMALSCKDCSYSLIIHLTNDDINLEHAAIQRLRELQAFAVVMVPSPGYLDQEHTLLNNMEVIQLIRERPMKNPYESILISDEEAIQDAVLYLTQKGRENITYIGADEALTTGRSRLMAFKQGLANAGLPVNSDLIFTDTPSFNMGSNYANEILKSEQADAIVSGGVEISNGILSAFMQSSRGLNDNCDFVGYGDPSFYSWIDGGITTIQIPVIRLAEKAVSILHAGQSKETTHQSHYFQATLVTR